MKLNKVYNENCIETMHRMPRNCIDLIVTSPPYDNLRDYDGYTVWNFSCFKTISELMFKIVKEGGVIVWVVNDQTVHGSETGTSFRHALWFKRIGFNIHDTMIHLKTGFNNPSNNRYHQVFQYMLVLSKGRPKTFNPIKDRRNMYKRRGAGGIRQKDGSMARKGFSGAFLSEYGQRFNVWMIKNNSKMRKYHPATFPLKLAADHIKSWSNVGEIVYDPFMGSGTTAVAAIKLERKWIGSEINKEYCRIINKRTKQ